MQSEEQQLKVLIKRTNAYNMRVLQDWEHIPLEYHYVAE